ncbi:MAG: low specificity L-threonine aldolase [Rikenellaceae bacterium]|nr:low specificity L-threonine aldolase [Rikenellaceae bacterium]
MNHSFGSDNHSGIHPLILEAIAKANTGHVPAYGDDIYTAEAKDTVKEIFSPEAEVYFVFNGTGANVLALRSITRPFNAIFCAATAHVWENECGAPECHTGCKFIALPSTDGKITPEQMVAHLAVKGNPHHNQPAAVTVALSTEVGTLYTPAEIKELADFAHRNGIYLHIDGTRLANAVAALGCTAQQLVTDTGVDVLSFGGTKNGMLGGESVIYLNATLGRDAGYERKQLMQLNSKMRFTAAQFETYLKDGLWLENAKSANSMAAYLAERVSEIDRVEIPYPVQTNMVFAKIPESAVEHLSRKGLYRNVDPANPRVLRWVCSFDTTREDVDLLIEELKESVR